MYAGPPVLGELVAARATRTPDHVVLRFPDSALTCAQLDDRTNRIANGLAERRIDQGDNVAVLAGNSQSFVETWVALAKAGAVEIPLNVAARGDSLVYLLETAECSSLIVDEELLPRIAAVAPRLSRLRQVFTIGAASPIPSLDVQPFEILLDGAPDRPQAAVAPSDHSVVLFTSGTTGPSKGVVLTHSANFQLAGTTIEGMGYGPGEALFTPFPLFHVGPRYCCVLPALLLDGASILIHPRLSVSRFWDICRENEITTFNYIGALIAMLMKQPERRGDRDHLVRRAYGAPAPATLFDAFEARFGTRLVEAYGGTEAGIALMTDRHRPKVGSCGRGQPYIPYEVEIHDEHDRVVAPGIAGEFVVRPKRPGVLFSGYYRDPDATLEAFRNLWFHTGDRGVMDENGDYTYLDRIKDSIRRRGENISSWEVECAIDTHPAVQESAIVGVSSELSEEEVLAVVHLKTGMALDPHELRRYLEDHVPAYALPRYIRFAETLPKNASNRVLKYELRDEGLTPDTWDAEGAAA
jgi:crotonobetaine/carnitine-CoA ligase